MQLGSIALLCFCAWTLGTLWAQTPGDRRLRTTTGSSGPGWASFDMEALRSERSRSGRAYLDFLGASTLSTGLYVLPRGAQDGQSPHDQDEVYAVQRGRATLMVEEESIAVEPGSVVFVAAHVPHRFVDIEEDLEVLVFFSSAAPIDPEADAEGGKESEE